MTLEQVKKTLDVCSEYEECVKCPAYGFCGDLAVMTAEALNAIEKLEKGDAIEAGEQKSIRELQKEIHQNAVDHGWWDNPRTPGELLMLVVSEVSEAFEEVRNNHTMTETYYGESGKMEGVPSELADIVIRVMDLSEYYGIDLEKAIAEKHAFNKKRPFKHGGKAL